MVVVVVVPVVVDTVVVVVVVVGGGAVVWHSGLGSSSPQNTLLGLTTGNSACLGTGCLGS